MSRTKHTRPVRIIATSRVHDPRGERSEGDKAGDRKIARLFKELGVEICEPQFEKDTDDNSIKLPRISVQRARRGYLHPASKKDIAKVLEHFGELTWYGVREISLLQNSDAGSAKLRFGAFSLPGKILLYEQPEPPWICSGLPAAAEVLEEAGAKITTSTDGTRSKIDWTPDALRDFMLFEVLMHEIGHHLIQQFTGKRLAQVKRTKDHEKIAVNFARRCRESFFSEESK